MRIIQYSLRRTAAAGVVLVLALTGVIAFAQKVVTPPGIKNFGKKQGKSTVAN